MEAISRRKEYQENVVKYEASLKEISGKITSVVLLRVIVFVLAGCGIYFLSFNAGFAVMSGAIGAGIFVWLVKHHAVLLNKKEYFKQLIEINQLEISVLDGNYSSNEKGEEFLNPDHHYSYDIDLFGEGSFFQFFNRTRTVGGKAYLAEILQKNSINDIEKKQEAIKELSGKSDERQHYWATAGTVGAEITSDRIEKWLNNYKPFASGKLIPALLIGFSLTSVVLTGLLSVNMISGMWYIIWFILGILITGIYLKRINLVYNDANKIADTINQYAELLKIIEKTEFKSELLVGQQKEIETSTDKASLILTKLGRALDRLNSRNNFLIGIFGNSLFLWDILSIHLLERWITKYSVQVEKWFKAIYFFDAYQCAANYSYNHSNYCFPKLNQDNNVIEAKSLGHPLILDEKRINNDFTIHQSNFVIITGANMAGKSTFLRTISLNLVLANAGFPTSAKEFKYSPIKLITSMRTSDSLQKEESYFFSELKRLKFIVEEIDRENYFIILDEILKGTNSKDKEAGSKKFVEKLVASGSSGIIATHDLGLCTINQKFPQVVNHYFDAEIINDELHFDYMIKDGVCQNMNASFLLRKMEIVDE